MTTNKVCLLLMHWLLTSPGHQACGLAQHLGMVYHADCIPRTRYAHVLEYAVKLSFFSLCCEINHMIDIITLAGMQQKI